MRKTAVLLSAFIKSDRNFNRNIIFIFAIFMPTAIIWCYCANRAYDILSFINRQDLVLTMAFSMFPALTFFSAVLQTTINLYFSKTIENVIHLPFTPFDILSAKFAETMTVEYTVMVITLFPTMVLFGYKSGAGFLFYVYSILLFFFFLASAVALGISFSMVLMRLLNTRFLRPLKRLLLSLIRYFDILSLIAGVLIGAAIVINAKRLLIAFFRKDSSAIIDFFYSGRSGFWVKAFSRLMDLMSGATDILTGYKTAGALHNLFAAAVICAFCVLTLFIVGELLYFKGFRGIGERLDSSASIFKSGGALKNNCVQKSLPASLVFKEVRTIIGSPVFFKYCFLVNFLLPASLLIFLISGKLASPGFFAVAGKFVNALYADELRAAYMLNFFVMSSLFTPAASAISASAFAREGKDLYTLKSLPVTYGQIITAKFLTAGSLNLSSSLLLIVSIGSFTEAGFYFIVSAVSSSVLAVIFMTASGLLAGLEYFDADADNEYQAVRGFCCNVIMLAAIIAAIIFYLAARLKLNFLVYALLVNSLLFILAVASSYLLFKRGKKLYDGI